MYPKRKYFVKGRMVRFFWYRVGKLLTTAQVATILGVEPRRVRQLIERGQLHAERTGRDWLIDPQDLKRYKPQKRGRPRKR